MSTLLAEGRIGAELKAAQARGEIATQADHGRGIQASDRASDTRATLPDLGIPRQRASEFKALPSPRTIRRALDVLLKLPADALADLAERLIDRLDAAEPDADAEAGHEGCCEAGDDDPASSVPGFGVQHVHGPGDPADAEDDDPGEDDDPQGSGDGLDEPRFPWRQVSARLTPITRGGVPVTIQALRRERRALPW